MRGWLLTALLAAALAAPAQALEFEQGTLRNGTRVIFAKGEFVQGDTDKLSGLLARAGRVDEIWFHSGGGLENEGYGIGRLIRKSRLATRVPKGSKCASACTDAFMGGVIRMADDEKSIGIHMATGADAPRTRAIVQAAIELLGNDAAAGVVREYEQAGARSAADWTKYVMEMGVSIRVVDVASSVSSGSMHWLSGKEMRDLNMINVRD